jgi:hypothetical protein
MDDHTFRYVGYTGCKPYIHFVPVVGDLVAPQQHSILSSLFGPEHLSFDCRPCGTTSSIVSRGPFRLGETVQTTPFGQRSQVAPATVDASTPLRYVLHPRGCFPEHFDFVNQVTLSSIGTTVRAINVKIRLSFGQQSVF